ADGARGSSEARAYERHRYPVGLAGGAREVIDPRDQRIRQFSPDLRILASRARRDVKRMVGVVEQLERGTRAELRDQRFQQWQLRELVARPLQEQHRNP